MTRGFSVTRTFSDSGSGVFCCGIVSGAEITGSGRFSGGTRGVIGVIDSAGATGMTGFAGVVLKSAGPANKGGGMYSAE